MPQRSLSFGNGGGPRDYFNTNLNYTNNPTVSCVKVKGFKTPKAEVFVKAF
jgi:hypothetical protein